MAGLKELHFFIPGRDFPSVSVTGNSCRLTCRHCGGHYLEHMVDARDPQDLLKLARNLSGRGFLLSGGCSDNGKVDLSRHLNVLRKIHNTIVEWTGK